ncbi:MAG: hypothetical protein OK452_02780 [Thaumarchaeota archaeon]|nr:hypothetical protein [Nitrososphaerota archaeon]
MGNRASLASVLIVAVLVLAALPSMTGQNVVGAGGGQRRFGFAFMNPGGLMQSGYSASTFFNAMFLTPPYPSTAEINTNNGIGEITSQATIDFILSLMQQASAYPNIKLVWHFSFNLCSPTEMSQFLSALAKLGTSPYKSAIGAAGVYDETANVIAGNEGVNCSGAAEDAAFGQLSSAITSNGWQFVSTYYAFQGTNSNNWNFIYQTNFPGGDSQGALNGGVGNPSIVGLFAGDEDDAPFPSPGCSNTFTGGASATFGLPYWTTQSFAEGYTGSFPSAAPCRNVNTNAGFPPTIGLVLSTAATQPAANSQYVVLDSGHMATQFYPSSGWQYQYFTGVSGVSTHWLWDNPAFRAAMTNEIAALPGAFITSTGATVVSTSTISTAPTTSTATTSTTSSTLGTATSTTTTAQGGTVTLTLSTTVTVVSQPVVSTTTATVTRTTTLAHQGPPSTITFTQRETSTVTVTTSYSTQLAGTGTSTQNQSQDSRSLGLGTSVAYPSMPIFPLQAILVGLAAATMGVVLLSNGALTRSIRKRVSRLAKFHS